MLFVKNPSPLFREDELQVGNKTEEHRLLSWEEGGIAYGRGYPVRKGVVVLRVMDCKKVEISPLLEDEKAVVLFE